MSTTKFNQIGVIGLAVMGSNLARNFASKEILTAVYNRSYEKTQDLIKSYAKNLTGYKDLSSFVNSLERPRKIILMIKSGQPVDLIIESLYPLLENGDILIDAGNSNYKDTSLRQEKLREGKIYNLAKVMESQNLREAHKVIHFIGCGVSGGEEGALNGPSLMPSGEPQAVEALIPLLKKIAAKDFQNQACVTNVGLSSSGHFVKMVHNGIEYALMQAIAEIYDLLRFYSFSNAEIQSVFKDLNSGDLESYLLEITIKILINPDDLESGYLLDKIKDEAKAKGTGAWTVEEAMSLGVATPSIAASVIARTLSARNQTFGIKHKTFNNLKQYPSDFFRQKLNSEKIRFVVKQVFEIAYLQGLDLIQQANQEYKWQINLHEVIRIWQGGCIIRSKILETIGDYFNGSKVLDFAKNMEDEALRDSWTSILQLKTGIPTPVVDATWNYLIGLSNRNLPTNLIQAQRDFFGAHTYQRIDKKGDFSGGWKL